MGHEPTQTHRRATVPSPLDLGRLAEDVRQVLPSVATLRDGAMDLSVHAHRIRTVAASVALATTVSVMAPTMSTAQQSGGTGQQLAQSDSDSAAPDEVPQLSAKAKALKRKERRAWRTGAALNHRVVAGESLWSLARMRVGKRASDAQVYRYLVKTWNKNEIRIGTGDPNLVLTGTVLKLPPVKRPA